MNLYATQLRQAGSISVSYTHLGQAVAAKRSEREASEGCVLAKTTGDRAVIVALKCETDFVAQNADFVKLTQDILDLAVANKCATLDEVKALPMGNGTVQDAGMVHSTMPAM